MDDPAKEMAAGKVLIKLHGQKLMGLLELVSISKPGDKQDLWIFFKELGDERPCASYRQADGRGSAT